MWKCCSVSTVYFRRFSMLFGNEFPGDVFISVAVLSGRQAAEMGPTTCYSLRLNTASIMKI